MHRTVIPVPLDEIDLGTAAGLRDLVDTLDPTDHVVLDLRDVSFCDTTGISELIRARNRHHAAGGSLRVVNPRPQVRNLIQWAGLAAILDDTDALVTR